VFVSRPALHKPNPFSSVVAETAATATALYSGRREIDMSPWIYGSITGDFETPRKQTVGKGKRKKVKKFTTLAGASEIQTDSTRTNNWNIRGISYFVLSSVCLSSIVGAHSIS
jgi:hypothetical protein